VVPDVRPAQCPRHRRLGGAGGRHRAGPGAGLAWGRARPAVDRNCRRRCRLCGAPHQRGAAMSAPVDFAALAPLWPYVLLVLVGILPNGVWRMLGVVLAHGLNEDSEIIVFARATATAILTGVVGKLVIFAPGSLAGVPLAARIGALALGVTAFWLAGRSVFAG